LAHHLTIPRPPSLLLYWLTLPAHLMGKAILLGLRHRVLSMSNCRIRSTPHSACRH